jgi:alpha-L-rhamnosidase
MKKVTRTFPKLLLLLMAFYMTSSLIAQKVTVNPDLLNKPWPASWIGVARASGGFNGGGFGAQVPPEFSVYHFRKNFDLTARAAAFVINVSADNRYKLYVNGVEVSHGPAAGSPKYWNFETVDIATHLQAGKNTISALVWNAAGFAPIVQMSTGRLALIVQGNSEAESIINTNTSWKLLQSKAYKPIRANGQALGYIAIGYTEDIDYNNFETGWERTNYNDEAWVAAGQVSAGETLKGTQNGGMGGSVSSWVLQPGSLPAMEMTVQRLVATRSDSGFAVPKTFPSQSTTFTVPANTRMKLLLDQGFLTNAYPILKFGKGKGSNITIGYAETLYNPPPATNGAAATPQRFVQRTKGNRNDVEGKIFIGFKDHLVSGGKEDEQFTSLWYRTYRYVQVEITTAEEPLVIKDFYGVFTGYPFDLKAKFASSDASLDKILEVGWRTARLCAMDTYMDCPYYERLQYVGDARIQAMISLYNTGDDRLMRQLLSQIDHSRTTEGLTYSRYPDNLTQFIPFFSLVWVDIIHDYYWYRQDKDFIKSLLPGMRQVLNYFSKFQNADGTIEGLPNWKFTDWVYNVPGWSSGNPPLINNGNSSVLDLQLLWAYENASELETALGNKQFGADYKASAELLKKTIRSKYWSGQKGLFADDPNKKFYSQHANVLAVLTGVTQGREASAIMKTVLSDTSLAPASIYFKYYLHQAANKTGYGDRYVSMLDVWRHHLSVGLTTWGETTDPATTRSDSHAWGSSPNIELYRILLGIDSDAPGFSKVKIEPHLGELKKVNGEIPHPKGIISASYLLQSNNKWKIDIALPATIGGYLLWKGKRYELKAGKNSFEI